MKFATLSLLSLFLPLFQTIARAPDVVFVPTPQIAVAQMLEVAEVGNKDVLYDLGSGDGRIVVTAAKKHGARAVGFDIDPQRVKEGKENVLENRVEHLATIREGDIFEQDLSEASVVSMYLLPELNVKLVPQLLKLKPGSRIVTYAYDIAGYKPDKVVRAPDGTTNIYLFKTPLKKE
jgi:predicted RNA methylase